MKFDFLRTSNWSRKGRKLPTAVYRLAAQSYNGPTQEEQLRQSIKNGIARLERRAWTRFYHLVGGQDHATFRGEERYKDKLFANYHSTGKTRDPLVVITELLAALPYRDENKYEHLALLALASRVADQLGMQNRERGPHEMLALEKKPDAGAFAAQIIESARNPKRPHPADRRPDRRYSDGTPKP